MAPRSNPASSSSAMPWVLGGGALLGLYLLTRRTPAPAVSPPVVAPPVPPPPPTLIDRLSASAQARRVFWLQATAYSLGLTDAYPDGLQGTATDVLVARLNAPSGTRGTTIDDAFVRRAVAAFGAPSSQHGPVRLIPNWLPRATVEAVNATARAASRDAMLLQIQPA